MSTPEELRAAAKLLAENMSPQQAVALVGSQYNDYLWNEENAKVHPMSDFSLPDADWQTEKAHMMDGGGVVEIAPLATEILTAMTTDDQTTFWRDLIHLYKSTMKVSGFMVGMPGGGTFLRGVATDDTPPMP